MNDEIIIRHKRQQGNYNLLKELKGLSYVKATTISEEKALLMEEIKEAIEILSLVRERELKARPAKDLLDEL